MDRFCTGPGPGFCASAWNVVKYWALHRTNVQASWHNVWPFLGWSWPAPRALYHDMSHDSPSSNMLGACLLTQLYSCDPPPRIPAYLVFVSSDRCLFQVIPPLLERICASALWLRPKLALIHSSSQWQWERKPVVYLLVQQHWGQDHGFPSLASTIKPGKKEAMRILKSTFCSREKWDLMVKLSWCIHFTTFSIDIKFCFVGKLSAF